MLDRKSQQVWKIQQKSAHFHAKSGTEVINKISTSFKKVSKMAGNGVEGFLIGGYFFADFPLNQPLS